MNKRQAKKAFKKKYGNNPGQVIKILKSVFDEYYKLLAIIKETIEAGVKDRDEIIRIVAKKYTKE